MTKILVIAKNTMLEILRDRILYGLIIFAILLIGLSLALGGLSFAEQSRITLNFGLVGIQLASAILSIFIGSTLVSKEIEKQTILTILSRPISRSEFLLGKILGLLFVLIIIVLGLSVVQLFVASQVEANLDQTFLIALFGIILEAMVLLSITVLFGVIIRPLLTVSCSMAMFMIGHWISSLNFFVEKSDSSSFKMIGKIITTVVPNLERFNWRSLVIYSDPIPWHEVSAASAYAFGWVLILFGIANVIFRRRDFV